VDFLHIKAAFSGTDCYSLGVQGSDKRHSISITMVTLNYINNRFMKFILVNFTTSFLPAIQFERVMKYRNLKCDNGNNPATMTNENQQLVDHCKTDR
jgi:hypothetical protein